MNAKTFDEMVKARAEQRLQVKLKKCRQAIVKALHELGVSTYPTAWDGHPATGGEDLDAALNGVRKSAGWPKKLWEREEDEVRTELLETMDEMQKALLAVGRDTSQDETPEQPKP